MRIFLALLLSFCVGCAMPTKTSISNKQDTIIKPAIQVGDVHDTYHVVVFAYQDNGWRPKPIQSHVFATWAKSRDKRVVEQVDISWCPAEDNLARAAISEVPGRNKGLATTLKDVTNHKLVYWIFKTDKTFYDAAQQQRDNLKMYKAIDNGVRPNAVNCIHACSDVAGHLETGTKFGIPAGQAVAEFYQKSGKAWNSGDRWIIDALSKN